MILAHCERTPQKPATGRQRTTVLEVLRLCGDCAHCLPEGKRHRCPTEGVVGLRTLACEEWTPLEGVAPATRVEQLQGKCGPGLPEMVISRPEQVKAEGRVDALKSASKAACLKRRDAVRQSGLKH